MDEDEAKEVRHVPDEKMEYSKLVTQSVWVSRKANRIQYTFLTEMWNCLTPADRVRIHSLLENVDSILGAVLRDMDRSMIRKEI